MRGRIDGHMLHDALEFTGQRMDFADPVDLIAEKLHPDHNIVGVRRINLHHVAAHPEFIPDKIDIVALILQFHQLGQQFIAAFGHPRPQRNHHAAVINRVTKRINAGHARDNDDIPPFGQRRGRRMAQLVDLIVDRGILFDIGIGRRYIRLRLIIVVIGDKILHRVFRKKFPEFRAQLCGERLVVREHQGRPVDLGDDVGHRKGFPRACNAQQGLFPVALADAVHQLGDRLRLVAGRLIL